MYFPVIGLEIHIELKTRSKMFCSCANDPLERHPNVNVCPICMGHPGTLPVINKEAVDGVIKSGLALNCKVSESSKFDRKNYFYPDLPKGYQISQYDLPLCKGGFLKIGKKNVRIRRIHLEEDTGRLIHPQGEEYSLVDFNRAGVPLMELVTEPDLESAQETSSFAKELQLILRYLEVSDADMEKGQMRVEANISMRSDKKSGGKVEIKNLNSFKAVEKGIAFEIERQGELLKKGKKVVQETRGWNEKKGQTVSQRIKEEAHDYRYFPEPDLPPLGLDKKAVGKIKSEIPELPQKKRERFRREYGLQEKEAEVFIHNKSLSEYFEKVVSEFPPNLAEKDVLNLIRLAVNYITTDLQGLLQGGKVSSLKIEPHDFSKFISFIHQGVISSRTAKSILAEMFATGGDPSHILKEKDLGQISDDKELESAVQEIVSRNPKAVEDYKKGKKNALQFLMGQVMAVTKGRANPETVAKILEKILQS